MTAGEFNRKDLAEEVQRVLDYVHKHVFEADAVDITRFYSKKYLDEDTSKSASFVRAYNIQSEDVRNAMAELRMEQYVTTSVKSGCLDAYVFGIHMPEIVEDDPEIYLKFQIDNGFIIVTIHKSERPLSYPYGEE